MHIAYALIWKLSWRSTQCTPFSSNLNFIVWKMLLNVCYFWKIATCLLPACAILYRIFVKFAGNLPNVNGILPEFPEFCRNYRCPGNPGIFWTVLFFRADELRISNLFSTHSRGRRFQDKSEKVRKERQLKPGTKVKHGRSNQGLVQVNCLKTSALLKATYG